MPWTRNSKGTGYRTRRGGNIRRPRQYEALRRKGLPKRAAAKITNARKRGRP